MSETAARAHLNRHLHEHLNTLGYTKVRALNRTLPPIPEIVRISPARSRVAYGQTVLRSDLKRRSFHERLLSFSQRRTRRGGTIVFFVGVGEADLDALNALLEELEIRKGTRGGHVQVIAIPPPTSSAPRRKPQAEAVAG